MLFNRVLFATMMLFICHSVASDIQVDCYYLLFTSTVVRKDRWQRGLRKSLFVVFPAKTDAV